VAHPAFAGVVRRFDAVDAYEDFELLLPDFEVGLVALEPSVALGVPFFAVIGCASYGGAAPLLNSDRPHGAEHAQ